MWAVMIFFVLCLFGVSFGQHAFFEIPGGRQLALSFFPPILFNNSRCGIVVTSLNVFLLTSTNASLRFDKRVSVFDFCSPNASPVAACVLQGPLKSYVAVADSSGVLSFSSFSSCDGPFIYESTFTVQLGSSDNSSQVLAVEKLENGDRLFISPSFVATVGFVQGALGLQPGVRSVRKFVAPLQSFVGAFKSEHNALMILQDIDSDGYQRVSDGSGNVTAVFEAGGFPSPWFARVGSIYSLDGIGFAAVFDNGSPAVFAMYDGGESRAEGFSSGGRNFIPSSAFGPKKIKDSNSVVGIVFAVLDPSDHSQNGGNAVFVSKVRVADTLGSPIFAIDSTWIFRFDSEVWWSNPSNSPNVDDSGNTGFVYGFLESPGYGLAIVQMDLGQTSNSTIVFGIPFSASSTCSWLQPYQKNCNCSARVSTDAFACECVKN